MTPLLILSALCTIALGYIVAKQADRFPAGGASDGPPGSANRGILVFGAPEVADGMRRAGIRCRTIPGPQIPEGGSYSALFALSGSDADNLAVCRAARQYDPGIYIVARCGVPELRGRYEEAGASRLLGPGDAANTLVSQLRGEGV